MRILAKESKKIASSIYELKRRRLNWELVTQEKIENKFREVVNSAREEKYQFSLSCKLHNTTTNEATVQLSAARNKTGVIENINTPNSEGFSCVTESGSALIASFTSEGTVAFIIYPYKSTRHYRNEKNIILYADLSPDDVIDPIIEKCISRYLLYIRCSSVYGTYSRSSITDIARMSWITIIDIRNRQNLYKSVIYHSHEWSKIIGAGIIGYIVAALTKGP